MACCVCRHEALSGMRRLGPADYFRDRLCMLVVALIVSFILLLSCLFVQDFPERCF